jgi:lipopolysaccharide transport system permease protein
LFRELAQRFNSSLLGWVWAILAPAVIMLGYAAVFTDIISISGATAHTSFAARSVLIFCGVVVFNFFAEILYRAPGLMHEHAAFVKRSIFPTEVLAWVAVLRTLVYFIISLGVLFAFELLLTHNIPVTALLLPLLLIPLVLFLMGATWFLMALGSFTRDVVHLMATIIPLLMLATPVFYISDNLPIPIRNWMKLNIMADYISMARDILIFNRLPGPVIYLSCVSMSYAVFVLGYAFFQKYKSILIDVI